MAAEKMAPQFNENEFKQKFWSDMLNQKVADSHLTASYPKTEFNKSLVTTVEIKTMAQLESLLKRTDVSYSQVLGGGSVKAECSKADVGTVKNNIVQEATAEFKSGYQNALKDAKEEHMNKAAQATRQAADNVEYQKSQKALNELVAWKNRNAGAFAQQEKEKSRAEQERMQKLAAQWTEQVGKLMRSGKLDLNFGPMSGAGAVKKQAMPSETQALLDTCIRKNGEGAFNPALLQSAIDEANQRSTLQDYAAKWKLAK